MEYENQMQTKPFGDLFILDTWYPDEHHSAKIASKCPNGTISPTTSCPCMDIMKGYGPRITNEPDVIQRLCEADTMYLQEWTILFQSGAVYQLGSCVYKELARIADYGAAFFADEYLVTYKILFESGQDLAGIIFLMFTSSLLTGKEYTESMAGRQQEYFDYLSDFVQREYRLSTRLFRAVRNEGSEKHFSDISSISLWSGV